MDVIVRIPFPRSGDSQSQETSLAHSASKQTRNYDIEGSNRHPSLSNLTPKGLSHSKMKRWAIHANLPVDVIFRLPHRRSGESQNQETFLAPSAHKQTRNYDVECSNHHRFLSTLRPKKLSHSKMKWWAIYKNVPVGVIIKLRHPRSGERKWKETFLAPSADKQTHNSDIECSNQYPSLST